MAGLSSSCSGVYIETVLRSALLQIVLARCSVALATPPAYIAYKLSVECCAIYYKDAIRQVTFLHLKIIQDIFCGLTAAAEFYLEFGHFARPSSWEDNFC
jgi:hypothetical protein